MTETDLYTQLRTNPDWRKNYIRIGKSIVRLICVIELVGLTHKTKVPSITHVAHKHRNTWPGKLVILAGITWLTYHLLFEPGEFKETINQVIESDPIGF